MISSMENALLNYIKACKVLRHIWSSIFLASSLVALNTPCASDWEPILSVLWRERTHGLHLSAIPKAHNRDTLSNFSKDAMSSIRPSNFPSSDVIGLENCKDIIFIRFSYKENWLDKSFNRAKSVQGKKHGCQRIKPRLGLSL